MARKRTSQLGGLKDPKGKTLEECTMLIRKLLFHYQVDPNVHHQGYSEEEEEDDDSSGSSSEEEEELPVDKQHVDLEDEYERYQADVAGQSDVKKLC